MITIKSIEDLKNEYKALNRVHRTVLIQRSETIKKMPKFMRCEKVLSIYKKEIHILNLNYKNVENL